MLQYIQGVKFVSFIIGFALAGAAEIDLGAVVGKLDDHDKFLIFR